MLRYAGQLEGGAAWYGDRCGALPAALYSTAAVQAAAGESEGGRVSRPLAVHTAAHRPGAGPEQVDVETVLQAERAEQAGGGRCGESDCQAE